LRNTSELAEHRVDNAAGYGWVAGRVSRATLTRAMLLVNTYYCVIIIRTISENGFAQEEQSWPAEETRSTTLSPSLVFPFHLECREFKRLREEDVCERIGNLEDMMNWKRSAGLAKRSDVADTERCFMRERS